MFYGAVLTPGSSNTPTSEDGQVLHLSQACLVNPTSHERTYLQVTHNDKTYNLCSLQKDKCENATLDLFFATQSGVSFCTSGGKNEVHLVGYFEPSDDEDDESDIGSEEEAEMMRRMTAARSAAGVGADDSDNEEDSDDEAEAKKEEDSSEDEAVKARVAKVVKKKMAAKPTKGAAPAVEDEDEDEEGSSDEDMKAGAADSDDEEGSGAEEDSEVGGEGESEEEESEDEEEEPAKPTKATPTKPQMNKNKQQQQKGQPQMKGKAASPPKAGADKKRKAEETLPPSKTKQMKTEASGSPAEASFVKQITAYIKKEGPTVQLSKLAASVKKPDSIKSKWGQFLRSQSNFVVDGSNVSLK